MQFALDNSICSENYLSAYAHSAVMTRTLAKYFKRRCSWENYSSYTEPKLFYDFDM